MLADVTTTDTSFPTLIAALVVGGAGLSQIFVPLSVTVLGSTARSDMPAASAFFNLSRQIGGSIAIAALVTILSRSNAVYHERLAARVNLTSHAVQRYVQENALTPLVLLLRRRPADGALALAE